MAIPLTGLNVDHSMDNLRDPSVTEPATHIRQRFHVPSQGGFPVCPGIGGAAARPGCPPSLALSFTGLWRQ